jgi:hypothetical protein
MTAPFVYVPWKCGGLPFVSFLGLIAICPVVRQS